MIKFGTSGFRGIFADDFTKENVQKIAYAVSLILKSEKKTNKPIYIGFDNRFMACQFAKWMAEVLAFNGLKILFYDKSVHSPLISFQTKNNYVGIMITASHNHYFYNGIKIFLNSGRESDDTFNQKVFDIASKIDYKSIKKIDFEEGVKSGIITLTSNMENYLNSVLSFITVDKNKKRNFKVLFNAMHGSTIECMKTILDKIGVQYEIMKENEDPYFEYKVTAPYLDNIKDQVEKLKTKDFDFGFALDGDGDRISVIDKTGKAYDCNYISAVIYNHLINAKSISKSMKVVENNISHISNDNSNFNATEKLKTNLTGNDIKPETNLTRNYLKQKDMNLGGVVKNNAVSELIVKTATAHGFKSYDAKVGFKNIANLLLSDKGAIIGVESNGIAINRHIPYKDGVLIATILINIFLSENKSIKELVDNLKNELCFPSETLEFAYPVSESEKTEIYNKIFIEKQLPKTPDLILKTNYEDGFKMIFKNDYWGIIRFSGTENVVRIFAEMKNKDTCLKYIKLYENFIGVSKRQV